MICVACGKSLSPDTHICDSCGTVQGVLEDHLHPMLPLHPDSTQRLRAIAKPDAHGFFLKYWNGEYSLPFSFWIVGILIASVTVGLIRQISDTPAIDVHSARLAGFQYVGLILGIYTLSIWKYVGLWRSASHHKQRGGSGFWAGLVRIMVIVVGLRLASLFVTFYAPMLEESVKMAVGIEDTPAFAIELHQNDTRLTLSGGLPFGTTEAIKQTLKQNPSIRLIELNSQGGRIGEAFALYDLIREKRLATYTGDVCASACTLAFLAGTRKYIGLHGQLGFHTSSVNGLSGINFPEINADMRATLQRHGLPEEFIDHALNVPSDRLWFPSHADLLKAHVIDAVIDIGSFDFAPPNISAFGENK